MLQIGTRLIDLVDRHHKRQLRRFDDVDRFTRLRTHTVICRNHQNRDVCHLRTTGAHHRKCFMTWRINKRQQLSIFRNLIGTDVLRNTTCFRVDHTRCTDRVQNKRLSVVDVTHDDDDWWTRCKLLTRVRLFLFHLGHAVRSQCIDRFVFRCFRLGDKPKIFRHDRCRFVVDAFVERCQNSGLHQLLHHLRHRHIQGRRKFTHREGWRHLHTRRVARLHFFLQQKLRLLILHFLLKVLALFVVLPGIHDAARIAIWNFDRLPTNVKTELWELGP